MANIPLRTELLTDPLARGYAGMTDQQASDDLNDATTGRTQQLATLTSGEIYEALNTTEREALSATDLARVRAVLSLSGDIQVGPGSKARATLSNAFGGVSGTVAALAARVTLAVSRATELSLGLARPGHVHEARF